MFYQIDASPSEQDDKTPGRLQTVWPPPKAKNEEEKVGLKYTEAGNIEWWRFYNILKPVVLPAQDLMQLLYYAQKEKLLLFGAVISFQGLPSMSFVTGNLFSDNVALFAIVMLIPC